RHLRDARGELAPVLWVGTSHCGLRIADCGPGTVTERAQALLRFRAGGRRGWQLRPAVAAHTLGERPCGDRLRGDEVHLVSRVLVDLEQLGLRCGDEL